MGLQAQRQVSTAACARQGPSGPDQVGKHSHLRSHPSDTSCLFKRRSSHYNWDLTELELRLQQRPNRDEWACRRYFTSQLQPVPGRDLRDGIRSGSDDSWCNFPHITCWIGQELSQMIGSAGSTTGANCSLCEAGTFGTGAGQGASMLVLSNFRAR